MTNFLDEVEGVKIFGLDFFVSINFAYCSMGLLSYLVTG
jgi:hypothetical protein